jgi:hypothetical protein
MIVAYLVENFPGFYYRVYIGYYLERYKTVHSGHCWAICISPHHYSGQYIEPFESVHTSTVDNTSSHLNQSTPLQWTLHRTVWISPHHCSGHYIEQFESVHTITVDTTSSNLNHSTPLQWTLHRAIWNSPHHYSGRYIEQFESVHTSTVDTISSHLNQSTPLKWTVCLAVCMNPRQLWTSPSRNLKMEAAHCSQCPPISTTHHYTIHNNLLPLQSPPYELPISHPQSLCSLCSEWPSSTPTYSNP